MTTYCTREMWEQHQRGRYFRDYRDLANHINETEGCAVEYLPTEYGVWWPRTRSMEQTALDKISHQIWTESRDLCLYWTHYYTYINRSDVKALATRFRITCWTCNRSAFPAYQWDWFYTRDYRRLSKVVNDEYLPICDRCGWLTPTKLWNKIERKIDKLRVEQKQKETELQICKRLNKNLKQMLTKSDPQAWQSLLAESIQVKTSLT